MGRNLEDKEGYPLKILLQIGVVFGLYWVSQCIELLLPIPFPASVISLLLLLVLLLVRVIKVDHVQEKADFLSFFFVPVSVGIMNYIGLIGQHVVAFLTVCVVSTVLTYGATVTAVRLTLRLMARKEGRS